VQDRLFGVVKGLVLGPLHEFEIRVILREEFAEAPTVEQGVPALVVDAIGRIDEIAGGESRPVGRAGIAEAGRDRLAPEAAVTAEHVVDLGPCAQVLEALVHGQGETAEGEAGDVVHPPDRDSGTIGDIAVGGLLRVAPLQRQAHHLGRDQARQRHVAGDVGRRPHGHQQPHGEPHGLVAHCRQLHQVRDFPLADGGTDRLHLGLQPIPAQAFLLGEDDAQERQPGLPQVPGLREACGVLVLDDAQAVDVGLLQRRARLLQELIQLPLRPLEIAA